MEWSNENLRAAFTPRWPEPNSFNLLYNYHFDPYAGNSSTMVHAQTGPVLAAPGPEKINGYRFPAANSSSNNNNEMMSMMKKKRLTSDQLASLERSFQEEIKLDSDRKMKLARELGLQPRQIAVWFQNRRARWKAKQVEQLYDSLRQEYDAVSREKLRLQEEVKKLRAILRDQALKKNQASVAGTTDVSGGRETVESTSAASKKPKHDQMGGENVVYSIDEYNSTTAAASPYWPLLLP